MTYEPSKTSLKKRTVKGLWADSFLSFFKQIPVCHEKIRLLRITLNSHVSISIFITRIIILEKQILGQCWTFNCWGLQMCYNPTHHRCIEGAIVTHWVGPSPKVPEGLRLARELEELGGFRKNKRLRDTCLRGRARGTVRRGIETTKGPMEVRTLGKGISGRRGQTDGLEASWMRLNRSAL